MTKTNKKSSFKDGIQMFARSLIAPVTILAFAGLFLGIGAVMGKYAKNDGFIVFANVIKTMGSIVFTLLPLLFAMAIAGAFTNNNGNAIISSVIIYVAIIALSGAFFSEMKDPSGGHAGWSWFNVIDFKEINSKASVVSKTLGFNSMDMSVFGGFIAGPLSVWTFNKFKDQRMPVFLQMFQGQRFVPIMGIIISVPAALVLSLVWPWFSQGFILFGKNSGRLPIGLDSFLFGLFERTLLPTGLHHMFYSPLLYTSAGAHVDPAFQVASTVSIGSASFAKGTPLWMIDASPWVKGGASVVDKMPTIAGLQPVDLDNAAGVFTKTGNTYIPVAGKTAADFEALFTKYSDSFTALDGDRIAFQQINGTEIQFSWINDLMGGNSFHLGRFAAGKLPIMVFWIPAAGAAIVMVAPKENRKMVLGTVGSAALTSFLTGITEPFEYTFLFVAPWLFFGFHVWMAGLSYMLANFMGVYYGPTFGGVIDLVIYGIVPQATGQATNFWWLLVIGAGGAPIYYGVFYYFIKKFNLKTPGRDGASVVMVTKADYKASKASGETPSASKTKKTKSKKADPLLEKAHIMYKALGGYENLKTVTNCASRLRVIVIDPKKVDYILGKTSKPFGVVGENKKSQQWVFGPSVQVIADEVIRLFETKAKI